MHAGHARQYGSQQHDERSGDDKYYVGEGIGARVTQRRHVALRRVCHDAQSCPRGHGTGDAAQCLDRI